MVYRYDINCLRGISVLSVVLYHYGILSGGYIGVDIFFVISGFLITSIIVKESANNSFSLTRFYKKRFCRIIPALLFCILIILLFCIVMLTSDEIALIVKSILYSLAFLENFHLIGVTNYFDPINESNPLLHLWSLSIEEQFYIFWPLLILIYFNYKFSRMIILLMVLIAASLIIFLILNSSGSNSGYFSSFARIWEILLGCALSIYKPFFDNLKNKKLFSFAGYFLLIASISGASLYLLPNYLLSVPAVLAALILIALPNGFKPQIIVKNFIIQYIGKISYSLYLWHWIIISFCFYIDNRLGMEINIYTSLSLSFLFSIISYECIEKNFNNYNKWLLVFLCWILVYLIAIWILAFPLKSKLHTISDPVLLSAIDKSSNEVIDKNWLPHKCFLTAGENSSQFSTECYAGLSGEKIILLWGDSHAASLSPGLRNLNYRTSGYELVQLTSSTCPPIIDTDFKINPLCNNINKFITNKILEIRPQTVVLYAAWHWDEYDVKRLYKTLDFLKQANINNIILVGPPPHWKINLPKNIEIYYSNYNKLPPKYSDYGLNNFPKTINIDDILLNISKAYNIKYYSILDNYCLNGGCISIYLDEYNEYKFFSLDSGHLSNDIAVRIANDEVFKQLIFKK